MSMTAARQEQDGERRRGRREINTVLHKGRIGCNHEARIYVDRMSQLSIFFTRVLRFC